MKYSIFFLIFVSILHCGPKDQVQDVGEGEPLEVENKNEATLVEEPKEPLPFISCNISLQEPAPNEDELDSEKSLFPLLVFQLTYNEENPLTLKWDENFAHVLWERQLLITVENTSGKETSEQFRFRTSDTYPAESEVVLKKNQSLKSTLDLNANPGDFLSSMFLREEPNNIKVSLEDESGEKRVICLEEISFSNDA